MASGGIKDPSKPVTTGKWNRVDELKILVFTLKSFNQREHKRKY
jgi:hypothetical protein